MVKKSPVEILIINMRTLNYETTTHTNKEKKIYKDFVESFKNIKFHWMK